MKGKLTLIYFLKHSGTGKQSVTEFLPVKPITKMQVEISIITDRSSLARYCPVGLLPHLQ